MTTPKTTAPQEVQYISHILIGKRMGDGDFMVSTLEGVMPLARVLAEIRAARGVVEHMGIAIDPTGVEHTLVSSTFVMIQAHVQAARYLIKQQEIQDGKTTEG